MTRKELEELKSSVNSYDKDLKDPKASLKKTKDENKALKNSINALNIQLEAAKEKLQKQREEYEQVWYNLDHLE